MKFRIDFKIFLFCLLFYYTNQIDEYIIMLIFAFIHECSHLIMGIIVGMKVEKFEAKFYGFSIRFKIIPIDFNKKINRGNLLEIKKIIVLIAGPLANLIIAILVSYMDIPNKNLIINSNLVLCFFNIMPIYPLDGGRILKSILHINIGKRKSERLINNISYIALIIITAISSILILKIKNISIFLIVIVLWILVLREDRYFRNKNKIYELMDKAIEIKKD